MPPLDILIPDGGLASGISVVLVQMAKDWLIAPRLPAGTQRDAVLRTITYTSNLLFLLLFVLTQGIYRPQDIAVYFGLAFGQSLGAHFLYTTTTPGQNGADKGSNT